MIAAIHQPNFFPWMGYFRKIAQADIFIFLDSVQFPRTGRGCWTNRVRLAVAGRPAWVTCPIRRISGRCERIDAVEIDDATSWRDKMCRTLEINYGKSQYFNVMYPVLENLIKEKDISLSAYNVKNIRGICRILNMESHVLTASSLSPGERGLSGSALLADLCREIGAEVYLAGDGADGYEREEEYTRRGIVLRKSAFVPPPYRQTGAKNGFLAGLSIIDALMNCGPEETRMMVMES